MYTKHVALLVRYVMALTIIAMIEDILYYMQRKFSREAQDPKKDTYKCFREWVGEQYPRGLNEGDWEQVIREDNQYDYVSQSPFVGNYEIAAVGDQVEIAAADDQVGDGSFLNEDITQGGLM